MGDGGIIALTLLRHGRSRADDEGVHEGRYDSALTETGRLQAETRAREFRARGFRFDLIVTSPLQRAQVTAEIIAEVLQVPVEVDADWVEMDNGLLAGMKREIAAVKFPKPSFRTPYEPVGGTGESAWDLYCRAAGALQQVVRRGARRYLVVAHGGVLNAALATVVGTPPQGDRPAVVFAFGDLGYARLEYRPALHHWRLLEFSPGLPQAAVAP